MIDSLCQNYKQNAIVFFELNKCRVHPCAQMVYVNSLDYVFFVKSQSLSEYMYIIICVHIYWQRTCHLEGSTHRWTACVQTISKTLLFSWIWTTFVSIPCAQMVYINSLGYMFFMKYQSLSEYMYIIISVHIYWQRNCHLEGSTHWWTACVKTISKALLFSLNWTNFVSIHVLRWCM